MDKVASDKVFYKVNNDMQIIYPRSTPKLNRVSLKRTASVSIHSVNVMEIRQPFRISHRQLKVRGKSRFTDRNIDRGGLEVILQYNSKPARAII